jgi:DNA-binding HxlR family transcriptional regulator
MGVARFDDLQADLGMSRNVLADRLRTLRNAGVVTTRDYPSPNRVRAEYVLTDMGNELLPIVVAITQWGDRWLDPGAGPPIVFQHSCGAIIRAQTVCASCRRPLTHDDVTAFAGPGSKRGPGTRAADHLPTLDGHPETRRA